MTHVVVLTKQWGYWGERPLRDAIKLIVKGKVEIVKADESRHIHAGVSREGITFKMPAPLVIRLLNFVGYKVRKDTIHFSEGAVYSRDNNVCQYWHYDENKKPYKYRCTSEDRTIDHVIPKSRGGTNSFSNCVCACRYHNEKVKKNKTPEEAGLVLLRKPEVPKVRKGDMAVVTFSFNPRSDAHRAFCELMNMSIE